MSSIANVNVDPTITPIIDLKKSNTEYKQALQNTSLMGTAMTTMADIMLLFTELSNAKFAQMSDKTDVSRDAQDMANRVDRVIAELVEADDIGALPEDVIDYMRENNILVDGKTIDEFMSENTRDGAAIITMKEMIAKGGDQGLESKEFQQVIQHMHDHDIEVEGKNAGQWVWDEAGQRSGQKVTPENMEKLLNALESTGLDKGNLTAVKTALESASGRASDFVQQSQLKLQQLMQNFNTAVTMANSIQSMNAESTKSIAQSIR